MVYLLAGYYGKKFVKTFQSFDIYYRYEFCAS